MVHADLRKHARAPYYLCNFGALLTWKTGTPMSRSWMLCGLFYHLHDFWPVSLNPFYIELYNERQLLKKGTNRNSRKLTNIISRTNEQKCSLFYCLWTVYLPRSLKHLWISVYSLLISWVQYPASNICPYSEPLQYRLIPPFIWRPLNSTLSKQKENGTMNSNISDIPDPHCNIKYCL